MPALFVRTRPTCSSCALNRPARCQACLTAPGRCMTPHAATSCLPVWYCNHICRGALEPTVQVYLWTPWFDGHQLHVEDGVACKCQLPMRQAARPEPCQPPNRQFCSESSCSLAALLKHVNIHPLHDMSVCDGDEPARPIDDLKRLSTTACRLWHAGQSPCTFSTECRGTAGPREHTGPHPC